jgi:hypothetical protein
VDKQPFYFQDTASSKAVNVSNGIGVFDPSSATKNSAVAGFYSSNLVRNLFQDSSFTYPVHPINQQCKAISANCSSFVLSGGLQNITPWTFRAAFRPDDQAFVTIKDSPTYHIDFWVTKDYPSFSSSDCRLYGVLDISPPFQLCIKAVEPSSGVLATSKPHSFL